MLKQQSALVARYFFKNCAVSIFFDGEMRISRALKPGPKDYVFNRDFTPAGHPSEFIGSQSEFYQFLDGTSSSTASLLKKLFTIGYILCNQFPRNAFRKYGFVLVNEEIDGVGNGKSLFAHSISQFVPAFNAYGSGPSDPFFLEDVRESTRVIIVEGPNFTGNVRKYCGLCSDSWTLLRRDEPATLLPAELTPHLMLITNSTKDGLPRYSPFQRRFVQLEFSSYWGYHNRIDEYFGHPLFNGWDRSQWHLFDNLMLYCVREYLNAYSRDLDLFAYFG